jgi:hypothetical protein
LFCLREEKNKSVSIPSIYTFSRQKMGLFSNLRLFLFFDHTVWRTIVRTGLNQLGNNIGQKEALWYYIYQHIAPTHFILLVVEPSLPDTFFRAPGGTKKERKGEVSLSGKIA